MAERVNRGEIWFLELAPPDKRRPVRQVVGPGDNVEVADLVDQSPVAAAKVDPVQESRSQAFSRDE